MDNYDIASLLKLSASLMELHDENPFKIKAIQSAVFTVEKYEKPLAGLSEESLSTMEGISKSLASKIAEINTTGTTSELQGLLSQTPQGVLEMLNIKGIGPKKVRTIWKELKVETKEALLEACNNNAVAQLKGFGEKTQETIKQGLLYQEANKGFMLYAEAEVIAEQLRSSIEASALITDIEISGEVRRRLEVVETIQLVVATNSPSQVLHFISAINSLEHHVQQSGPFTWRGELRNLGLKIEIKLCSPETFGTTLYLNSSAMEHLSKPLDEGKSIFQLIKKKAFKSEDDIFEYTKLPFIVPELREGFKELEWAKTGTMPRLVEYTDLRGALHNHSKYSDGSNTIEEMAKRCIALGYEYFGIADHSKAGNFYNGGMYEEKVLQQQKEIDELNIKLAPFKILKGIEVDILNDGELDYSDEVMATFDYSVASIHSNLKMNLEKATTRLIKAIENPYTTMLGHASGRLLLKREGYPLDYKKVIDACAANRVAIEINAEPMRLDLDWRNVMYALEKGIKISINPDAHDWESLEKMRYGVLVGRKAGLTKEMTLNALSLAELEQYLKEKKEFSGIVSQ